MSKTSAFARISLTLPPEVLAEADRLAAELDRSRSWVITEAIRRLAGEEGATPRNPPASEGALRARLEADMARSTEDRVVAGERMAGLVASQAHADRDHLLSFRSYHGYLRWDPRPGGRP